MESSQHPPSWRRGFIDVWSRGSHEAPDTPDGQRQQQPTSSSWSGPNLSNTYMDLTEKSNLEHRHTENGDTHSLLNPRQTELGLGKQFESSDNSDVMDDGDDSEGNKRKTPMSKNLLSERKRRKKLNERLYSLRAIVPNISKMDKASIVSDAIDHIRDLQKQLDNIEADIINIKSQKEGAAAGDSRDNDAGLATNGGPPIKNTKQEQRTVKLEVTQMEESIYHLRISCKKSPGVVLQLSKALEALELEIVNANLTSVDDHLLNTVVMEVKNGWSMTEEDLRNRALEVIPKFGFHLCF